ncbi:MAG: hypothetical protein NZX77_06190 [Polyangiaceae bacterium]|nr:hypothetical protein [Polyangiaceae bacterium]
MDMRLPKEVFLALAALGWADGNLDENEGVALLRAAREAGLSEGELEEIKGAIKHGSSWAHSPCRECPGETGFWRMPWQYG